MSLNVSLSREAYTQALLHAAAHPSNAVVGLLLGTRNTSAAPGEVAFDVASALPLLHHWTALSPMAEVGSALAATHLGSSRQIVGAYYASASTSSSGAAPSEPEPTAARLAQLLADKLEAASPSAAQEKGKKNGTASAKDSALLLELNNSSPLSGDASFSAFLVPSSVSSGAVTSSSGKSGSAPGAALPASKALPAGSLKLAEGQEASKQAGDAIKAGRWKDVVDFDDHLEDTSKDWLTPLKV